MLRFIHPAVVLSDASPLRIFPLTFVKIHNHFSHKEARKAQKSAETICAFCASLWLKTGA
jgi:hypothetical protein